MLYSSLWNAKLRTPLGDVLWTNAAAANSSPSKGRISATPTVSSPQKEGLGTRFGAEETKSILGRQMLRKNKAT